MSHSSNPQPYPELRLLPKCSGCLRDFLTCSVCFRFTCGHFYCSMCAVVLQRNDGLCRCLFDQVRTTEEELMKTEDIREVVSEKIKEGPAAMREILGKVNYEGVPCRDLFREGRCNVAADCPYSHSAASFDRLRDFQSKEDTACWECQHCLLTLTRKLTHCPVCDKVQTHIRMRSPAHTEAPSHYNHTCEQTNPSEEERTALHSVIVPTSLQERRSACCCLQ